MRHTSSTSSARIPSLVADTTAGTTPGWMVNEIPSTPGLRTETPTTPRRGHRHPRRCSPAVGARRGTEGVVSSRRGPFVWTTCLEQLPAGQPGCLGGGGALAWTASRRAARAHRPAPRRRHMLRKLRPWRVKLTRALTD